MSIGLDNASVHVYGCMIRMFALMEDTWRGGVDNNSCPGFAEAGNKLCRPTQNNISRLEEKLRGSSETQYL